MIFLKQSTAVTINFGPGVAKADAVTVTDVHAAMDDGTTGIRISKNAGTLAARHASVTATTYDAFGMHKVVLDTTDTDTLGRLRVCYSDATILPIWRDFHVIPANIYDSLISGSDVLDVSITQLLGTAWLTPAVAGTPDVTVLAASKTGYALVAATMAALGVLDSGTAASIANGTITLRSGHGLSGLASALVILTGGTAAVGKSRIITFSSGDIFAVDPAWNANGESTPSGTITYVVMPAPLSPTATNLPAVNLVSVLGTALTETVGGYLAAGLKKLLDVAAPLFTLASINQTGDSYAVLANPAGFKKNTAVADFSFPMKDADGNLVSGLTVTGKIQKDGSAFAALTSAIAEVGTTGIYQLTAASALLAAEMNADQVMLLFTATGAKPTTIEIYTEP